jgi:TetR/AcrR family transcriptional regulator, tetracycline repressor protein
VTAKSRRAGAALSRDRIVELAIEHADSGGLEQVSMRRLAAELSVTPMALYWHFANREALVDAMAEQVAGQVAHDDDPDAPWQQRLRAVLTAALTVVQTHPWLGPLVSQRIVTAPNYLRALEVLLDALRSAGYGRQAAASIVDIAVDAVAAMAFRLPAAPPEEPPQATSGQLEKRAELLELPVTDYPRIRDAALPLTSPKPPGTYGTLGIDILVKGIEAAAPTSTRWRGDSRSTR